MSGEGAVRCGEVARSVLTFEPAVVVLPWGTPRSPVEREAHFLEPVVDGVALRARVVDHGVVGVFGAGLPALVERGAQELLGVRACDDLPPGRIGLLVCQVCEDLGCGSLTVALDVGGQEVVWSSPRWEDSWAEATVDERLGGATFCFERSAYEAAVRGAALAVADLPTWQPPARQSWWRRG